MFDRFQRRTLNGKISTGGGTQPEWRRDGKEFFYVAADGKLMAVHVSIDGATFEAGTPHSALQC